MSDFAILLSLVDELPDTIPDANPVAADTLLFTGQTEDFVKRSLSFGSPHAGSGA